jgi:hypothetical protein
MCHAVSPLSRDLTEDGADRGRARKGCTNATAPLRPSRRDTDATFQVLQQALARLPRVGAVQHRITPFPLTTMPILYREARHPPRRRPPSCTRGEIAVSESCGGPIIENWRLHCPLGAIKANAAVIAETQCPRPEALSPHGAKHGRQHWGPYRLSPPKQPGMDVRSTRDQQALAGSSR